jgi:MerR family transcriptional regulator, thiopeptide resistance regulator
MAYTVKQLADLAGVSVRTLHYYDALGLLKPRARSANGYRRYGEEDAARLQQIMFFRELGFGLAETGRIISNPEFDVLAALEEHRTLLEQRAARTRALLRTVDKTIRKMKGETGMDIKEYYQGFSDAEAEQYRKEARARWGEKTIADSEARVAKMGKEKFAAIQAEGGAIFQAVADNMAKGAASKEVQALVANWRQWLENFAHYSDEAVLGLGRAYSQDERFAKYFARFGQDVPAFLTRAIEYYSAQRK